ncbi:MAG: response regulator transcription factor [Bacteroidales bacterium]|nr:response regulator transcription factor [Bacteroidales bacterium]
MIKCIIVDDEFPARECIKNYLKDYCPDVEVVAQADSANSAYKEILDHHPDLLFLDVEMPNGSGFDLLRMMNKIDFHIIFVTAHEEYAVMAFRFSAMDYLLKPINIKELVTAIDKVRTEISRKSEAVNLETLKRITQMGPAEWDQIVIKHNEGFKVVYLRDIISCEADSYCTIFHISGNKKLVSSKNLKYYEDILTPHGFQRIHNSFLINLSHVVEYSSEGVVALSEGQLAHLGNTYKKKFMDYFERNK